MAVASGSGVAVGAGSGVAVARSAVGVGMAVSVGEGRAAWSGCMAVVGVNVGRGVRVAGAPASSGGTGSCVSREQPKVSKIKNALGMCQALDRDRDGNVASFLIRIYIT